MDEFITRWVMPFYTRGPQGSDVDTLRSELERVEPKVVRRLLSTYNWRERIVGGWFAGLKGWRQFESVIGQLLLASELCYAGQGYCFALACFADEPSRGYLTQYLDHYLARPELYYDQTEALCALMWVDDRHGTQFAAPYVEPDGPWERFIANKPHGWDLAQRRERFWQTMAYCRENFGTP